MRENNEFDSLPEILEALTSGKFPELTFVGKNYSKADLIRDLRKADTRIASLEADRENLWKMLDNISTMGDQFKPEINGYFKAVNKECEKRSSIMYSPDGYILLPTPPVKEQG